MKDVVLPYKRDTGRDKRVSVFGVSPNTGTVSAGSFILFGRCDNELCKEILPLYEKARVVRDYRVEKCEIDHFAMQIMYSSDTYFAQPRKVISNYDSSLKVFPMLAVYNGSNSWLCWCGSSAVLHLLTAWLRKTSNYIETTIQEVSRYELRSNISELLKKFSFY